MGKDCVIEAGTVILHPERLRLGNGVKIARQCYIDAKGGISIGDDTHLSPRVVLHTSSLDKKFNHIMAPLNIGNHVWLASNTIVVMGITIGDGSKVGAGSVVLHDIPEGTFFAGNPAKEIK